ncbi:MAG: cob(I)yrinic acid a,c-diamide adenosyltransferase [Verrucomicrobia bacterium]|nr:cob(I)yrinic acid a,c-diamide adenosyltransferase [Verrucomicrobiota bacterium]
MRRVLIFTGEGKGKTTAAMGMVLRAAGHGHRILVVQFIKADARTGELAASKKLPGVEFVQMGRGFIPAEKSPRFSEHREAALAALDFAAKAAASGTYDLIVLDEIFHAVAKNLIDEQAVLDLLRAASSRRGTSGGESRAPTHPSRNPPQTCVVMTGRGASERLIERADTVTEMRSVKHGFQQGIKAQVGVEF